MVRLPLACFAAHGVLSRACLYKHTTLTAICKLRCRRDSVQVYGCFRKILASPAHSLDMPASLSMWTYYIITPHRALNKYTAIFIAGHFGIVIQIAGTFCKSASITIKVQQSHLVRFCKSLQPKPIRYTILSKVKLTKNGKIKKNTEILGINALLPILWKYRVPLQNTSAHPGHVSLLVVEIWVTVNTKMTVRYFLMIFYCN